MLNDQSMQCNFCFYSFGPFYEVRILPITPVATLSGTATPAHARVPGARKIVCHHCRYSHYNITPWTEPEELPPSLPVPPEPAEQPIIAHPITCVALPVECDDDQSTHNGPDHSAILPSISLVSTLCLLNENIYREKLQRHLSESFESFLLAPLYPGSLCISRQSTPITIFPRVQASCRLADQSVVPSRAPPLVSAQPVQTNILTDSSRN